MYVCICVDCSECNVFTTNQSAVGSEYQADLAKHASQTDAAKGFGGKYGVQADRKDKVRCRKVRLHLDMALKNLLTDIIIENTQ